MCPRTNKECNEVNCRRIAIIYDPRQELARKWRPYGCNCIKNLYGTTERAVKSAGAQATVDRVSVRGRRGPEPVRSFAHCPASTDHNRPARKRRRNQAKSRRDKHHQDRRKGVKELCSLSDDDCGGGGHNVKAFGALTAVNAHVHGHRKMVDASRSSRRAWSKA